MAHMAGKIFLPLWAVVLIILGTLLLALVLLVIACFICRFYKKIASFSRNEDAFGMIVFEDGPKSSGKQATNGSGKVHDGKQSSSSGKLATSSGISTVSQKIRPTRPFKYAARPIRKGSTHSNEQMEIPDYTQTDHAPVASDQTEHFTFVGESSESCSISVVGEQKIASNDADGPQLNAVEVPPDKLEENAKTANKKEELILAVK